MAAKRGEGWISLPAPSPREAQSQVNKQWLPACRKDQVSLETDASLSCCAAGKHQQGSAAERGVLASTATPHFHSPKTLPPLEKAPERAAAPRGAQHHLPGPRASIRLPQTRGPNAGGSRTRSPAALQSGSRANPTEAPRLLTHLISPGPLALSSLHPPA